jgi:hypothetical protein
MNMGHSLYLYIVLSSIREERNQTHLFHILSDDLHVHMASLEARLVDEIMVKRFRFLSSMKWLSCVFVSPSYHLQLAVNTAVSNRMFILQPQKRLFLPFSFDPIARSMIILDSLCKRHVELSSGMDPLNIPTRHPPIRYRFKHPS